MWFDFETNAGGTAVSNRVHDTAIREDEAKSIVVHADKTDPSTGKAGAKLACIDLTFQRVL